MIVQNETSRGTDLDESPPDFETTFRLHYPRIVHAIARVVGDAACAEELAVEVFWKFWRNPRIPRDKAGGWLYRTAIRLGIHELRRRARHARYQRLLRLAGPQTPEEIRAGDEKQEQVRRVLSAIKPRDAELLLLQSDEFRYEEIASALDLNFASVGTLVSRARLAFRKEYTKLYGEPRL